MFAILLGETFFLADPEVLATTDNTINSYPDSPSDSLASSKLLTPPESPLAHQFGYKALIDDRYCVIKLSPVVAPDSKDIICEIAQEDDWAKVGGMVIMEIEKKVIKAKSALEGDIDYLYSFPDMEMIVGGYFKALLYDYPIELDTVPGYYIEKLVKLADRFALVDIHKQLKPYFARYKADLASARFVKGSYEDDHNEMRQAIEALLPEDQPKDILKLVSIAEPVWRDHLKEAIESTLWFLALPKLEELGNERVDMDWNFVAYWFGIILTKEMKEMFWKADGYRIGAARLRAICVE